MLRFLVIALLVFLFSNCCKKVACVFENWPSIGYKITPVNLNDTVAVYTLLDGVRTDSIFISENFSQTRYLTPFNFPNDETGFRRSFEIKKKNGIDLIKPVDLFFKEVKDECNCGLFVKKKKRKVVTDFLFTHNGNELHLGDIVMVK